MRFSTFNRNTINSITGWYNSDALNAAPATPFTQFAKNFGHLTVENLGTVNHIDALSLFTQPGFKMSDIPHGEKVLNALIDAFNRTPAKNPGADLRRYMITKHREIKIGLNLDDETFKIRLRVYNALKNKYMECLSAQSDVILTNKLDCDHVGEKRKFC